MSVSPWVICRMQLIRTSLCGQPLSQHIFFIAVVKYLDSLARKERKMINAAF